MISRRVVTYDMGQDIAKELNFDYFIETSVKNGSNNEELIIQATRLLYLEYKKLISKQNVSLLLLIVILLVEFII